MNVATSDRVLRATPTERRAQAMSVVRLRLAGAALTIAGIFFVLYPAIRPFSDEVTLDGAAAFGATAWIVAHMLAMVGFTLLLVGLLGTYLALRVSRAESRAFAGLVVTMLGIGLTLPFYGGEAFGLHAIGREALRQQDASLLRLAGDVRGGAGLVMFLTGLLLLAIGTIVLASAIWASGTFPQWCGVPLALGFSLYIPQFFGTQPLRVAHGLLVAAGCLWIAVALWRQGSAGEELS